MGRIAFGVILLVIGIALTLADGAAFGNRVGGLGGFLLVRWGFLLFGVLSVVRGCMILARASRFR